MSVDAALKFYMDHNGYVINWVFIAILVLSLVLLVLALMHKDQAEESLQSLEFESTLRKVLEEKMQNAAAPTAPARPQSGDENELTLINEIEQKKQEVEQIRADLKEKERIITELKAAPPPTQTPGAPAAAAAPSNEAELNELKTKLKDLEGKLAEYSIIEDDIADLSLYKEENARLHSEIEMLKKGVGQPLEAPPAGESPVTEPQATPEPTPAVEPAPVAAASAGEPPAPAAEPAAAPEAELTPTPPEISDTAPQVNDSAQFPVENPLSGDLKLDQMMAEMAELKDTSEEEVKNPLEDTLDTERIAQEADNSGKQG